MDLIVGANHVVGVGIQLMFGLCTGSASDGRVEERDDDRKWLVLEASDELPTPVKDISYQLQV